MQVQVEVCVASVEEAEVAVSCGADRLEICSWLACGGITPSSGLVDTVRNAVRVPVRVLVRPTAGGFDYSASETAVLLKEIARDHSVIVVEHDMGFIRELGVKVTVLHEGSVLAEGPLDQISANERVIEVYLGR